MNENQKNMYTWLLKIALEYRLSLQNICIILGLDATEENQKKVYSIFEELFGSNNDLKVLYDFLFKVETKNELEETSLMALNSGYLLFYQYQIASRNRDTAKINNLKNELDSLDNRINKLKNRDSSVKLTDNDYLNILRYRVKYSMSRAELCGMLNISSSDLIRFEAQLEDEELINKLDILNKHQIDIIYARTPSYDPNNMLGLLEEDYDSSLMEMCYKQL